MPVVPLLGEGRFLSTDEHPGNCCHGTSERQLGRSGCNCLCAWRGPACSDPHGTQLCPEPDASGQRSWPGAAPGAGQERAGLAEGRHLALGAAVTRVRGKACSRGQREQNTPTKETVTRLSIPRVDPLGVIQGTLWIIG